MKKKQLFTGLISLALLAGCSGTPTVEVSDSSGNATEVQVSTDGVKVNALGEEGSANINISGQGVSVVTDGEETTKVAVGANGETVSITTDNTSAEGNQNTTVATAQGDMVIISGAGEDRVIDGEGKKVVISGTGNDIEVTGNCLELVVSGTSNDVDAQSATKIVVTGTSNDVTYKSGNPKVVNTGVSNDVERDS